MPVLDTPITTDDHNLKNVLKQGKPVLLVMGRGALDKPLDDTLRKEAKKHAGELLVARVDTGNSPDTHVRYGEPPLPALVAFDAHGKVKADAGTVRPKDVRNHIAHLLEGKPLPEREDDSAAGGGVPITVTDKNFRKEVLRSKVPVLVDFWAEWCGPCHQIAPYIEQLAQEHRGKLKVAKLNVDHNQMMAGRYGVQSIPTMIVFEGGQPAARIVGANPVSLKKTVAKFIV